MAARVRKLLILNDGNLREVVGARGFELLAQPSVYVRQCSPVLRKQRVPFDLPPSPNPAEHRQTAPNVDTLLYTRYTRKAFLRHESGLRDDQM